MNMDDILWVVEELRVSDAEERRHIERIHILLTTAIIASYFTPIAQRMVSIRNIGGYTDSLVVISMIYLSLRLIDITIPLRKLHNKLDLIFGFIAPLGFLLSILGYLGVAFVTAVGIRISSNQAALVAISIVLVSVGLSSIRIRYDSSDPSEKKEFGSIIERIAEFENYVYENPNQVESGLTWDSIEMSPHRANTRTDLIGTDSNDKKIYGELKLGDINASRARNVIDFVDNLGDDGRVLLITNGKVTTTAEELLASKSIEVKEIQF